MKLREFTFSQTKRGDTLLGVLFEDNRGLEVVGEWVPGWEEVRSLVRHSLGTEAVNEARRGGAGTELFLFAQFFDEMASMARSLEGALPEGRAPKGPDGLPKEAVGSGPEAP